MSIRAPRRLPPCSVVVAGETAKTLADLPVTGRVALDPGRVAVDAWELEVLCAAAIMVLYHGPFIHHLAGDAGLVACANLLEGVVTGICAGLAARLKCVIKERFGLGYGRAMSGNCYSNPASRA